MASLISHLDLQYRYFFGVVSFHNAYSIAIGRYKNGVLGLRRLSVLCWKVRIIDIAYT